MTTLSRRDFARLLALSGTASLLPSSALASNAWLDDDGISSSPVPPAPQQPDERYWEDVRARFLVPKAVGFFNAANLCPMSIPVIEAMDKNLRFYEASPSPENRTPPRCVRRRRRS
jgi:hypothetical protein